MEAVAAAGGATIVPASTVEAARAAVEAREKEIGGSGGSLTTPWTSSYTTQFRMIVWGILRAFLLI